MKQDDLDQAKQDQLWDDRLDSASCSPVIERDELEDDDLEEGPVMAGMEPP